ncbi:MAG: type II toxin-antitoxin system HicB family antitoxin [Pyrinomonadaceae bacterium]
MSTTQYQVLVRSQSDDLFTAAVLGMVDCVAEGRTREEAIANAKAVLAERLVRGEIVTIELEDAEVETGATRHATSDVWREQAGRFRNDLTFDEFLAEIQRERNELDSDESAS